MAFNSALSKLQWKALTGGTYADVAAIGSISFSMSRPALDITPIGTPTSEFLAGVSNATASLDIFYDNDDTTHRAWLSHINAANAASFWLFVLETGESIEGQAFITSLEITAAANSVGRATIQLQFTKTPAADAAVWTVATGT